MASCDLFLLLAKLIDRLFLQEECLHQAALGELCAKVIGGADTRSSSSLIPKKLDRVLSAEAAVSRQHRHMLRDVSHFE